MMSCRFLRWIAAALLMAPSMESWAHRLDAAASYEGGALVIEAWFGDGSSASQGEVTITNDEGDVLVVGEMDEEGFFRWPIEEARALSINIYAGLGHNQTLTFSQDEMAALMAAAISPPAAESSERSALPARERGAATISTQDRFGSPERIVLGLTFIMAAAAAWLSYQNAKRLRAIQESMAKHDEPRRRNP